MKKCAIYRIRNTINNMSYVGSSIDVVKRRQKHRYLLRNGKHNSLIQHDYDLHGMKVFKFSILEYCDEDSLEEKEQYWIDKLDSYNSGYNARKNVCRCTLTEEQANKQIGKDNHQSKLLTFNNKTLSLNGWAKEIGICKQSLKYRLLYWSSLEKVLTTPKQK